jgi:tetratricopeptide (TPR) repeat protein
MAGRFVLLGAIFMTAVPALAARKHDLADCGSLDMDRRIIGCTNISGDGSEADHVRAVASYSLGIAYFIKGDRQRSTALFGDAVQFDPKLSRSYILRGDLYVLKWRYDDAIADYTQAILIKPAFAEAYRDRRQAYFAKGQHDLAVMEYSEAIRIDPRLIPPIVTDAAHLRSLAGPT